jgi:hypothetical protein
MHDISLRHIGQYLLIAVTAYFGINMAVFPLLDREALSPWHLPYTETFDYVHQLDYHQLGGHWQVQGGVLLQTVETGTDLMAVIPIQLQPEQAYRFQTHLDFRGGQHSGGLIFNLQQPNSRRQSQMVRYSSGQGQSYLVYGYFDERESFVSQGRITSLAQPVTSSVDLAVEVVEATYEVLVNGSPVASEIPLQYSGGQLALTTWYSQVAFDNISIDLLSSQTFAQPLAASVLQPATIITSFKDSFDDPSTQADWLPISGNWTFESGALVQSKVDGFDYAIAHPASSEQFILRAQFSHRQGAGAGVLFNMPLADRLRGAQIVRYFDENTLAWGYFDDDGIFQQQGKTPVTAPGMNAHILEVATNGSTYGITLDGKPVTAGIALHSPRGFIGLMASNTVVAFEQIELLTEAQ